MRRGAIAWCAVAIGGCAQLFGLDDRDLIDAAPGCPTMFQDVDGDGHGNPYVPISVCDAPPVGFVASYDDCAPNDATSYPGASEKCDGADNDCNSIVDDGTVCPTGCTAARRPPPDFARVYLICSNPLPWDLAEMGCVAAGGHLTAIQSKAENDFVAAVVTAQLGVGAQVWLGGSDTATENTWVWKEAPLVPFSMGSACSLPQYCGWISPQPNNGGGDEDCLALAPVPTWNDLGCANARAYVCRSL